ncbi:MAG: transposase, partial [Clostridia bacterium]|nr:transposase [Clostridia bacterium]
HFRLVRFPLSESSFETIITNLPANTFPPNEIKKLYAMRWGIETSFRDLKYTIGLLHFHAKKVDYILQEIFARLIMYNFSELITSHVVIQNGNRLYEYKVCFSSAAHICKSFLFGSVDPPDVETLIGKFILPVRPDRSRARILFRKGAVSFTYRVA